MALSWIDQLYALIRISLQILQTEEEAVQKAFTWLEHDQGDGTSDRGEGTSTNPAG